MINDTSRSDSAQQFGPFRLPSALSDLDFPRLRFSICLGLFGGLIGGAVSLIVPLTVLDPFIHTPQHPPLGDALIIAMPGFLSGLTVAGLLAYFLFGSPFTLDMQRTRTSRSLPIWIFIGAVHSLVFSLVLGGLFGPFISLFQDFTHSVLSVPQLLSKGLDTTISVPFLSLIGGMNLWFTSFITAGFFSIGAWMIDRFNTSADDAASNYGTWAIATLLCGMIIAFLTMVPETTLARLG
ncbi:MAG: hypothetical protein QGF12_01730 [SAR202 cluster bacterium]|nr:hypothetical protein [SAR202 cluster bacterium]